MLSAKEKALRWSKYGRLGQLKYGLIAAQAIENDKTLPALIRRDAAQAAETLSALSQKYSLALKGT